MKERNRHKVLLADDEPQNIKNLLEVLNPETYRVFVASNGKSAVEQALKHHPDAIIMDWDMPIMTGMEAISVIRAHEEIKDIPIIVATGKMTTVKNLRTALETGANDYIKKPFDPIEIKARINAMVKLSEQQKENLRLQKELMQKKLYDANREMEIKNQALATSKLRLINNSKNYVLLVQKLEKLFSTTNEEGKQLITKLISEIKANSLCIKWEEFENHFEKVHPSFFTVLRKKYSELTTNEIELCAFIKMNMTNKEIMAITHKTDNTFKKAKQRLKKKLGLEADDSLDRFISSNL
jgi:DNA-binding response OmpR family regulator/DNA-binding CsgD family transcriptional regulator